MFQGEHPHVSEEDLLLTADGELSAPRAARVEAHLIACWACRTRMAELEATIGEFTRLYRQELDAQLPPKQIPTRRLSGRMAQLAAAGSGRQDRPIAASSRWRHPAAVALAAALLLAFAGLRLQPHRLAGDSSRSGAAPTNADPIPRPSLTPGATLPVTRTDVCSGEYRNQPRELHASVKQRVFAEYGIADPPPDAYEIDYLITPELGGSSSILNLWPEPYFQTVWNARMKDALEDHLYRLVCDGDLELATAQREIATDWISAYKKYFHTDRPIPAPSASVETGAADEGQTAAGGSGPPQLLQGAKAALAKASRRSRWAWVPAGATVPRPGRETL